MQTSAVIEDILDGCAFEVEMYRRRMTRTAWRVEADFVFLQRLLPQVERVLDVGAIPPLLEGFLAHHGTANLDVMDPCAGRFAPFFERHGIAYSDGDLLAGNPPQEHYDLVCLCEVLEHIPGNILEALERVSTWVKPGGYLYLTTPNLCSVSGAVGLFVHGSGLASKSREPIRKQFDRARGADQYFGHIREFTEKEVRNLVEGMGYDHVVSKFQVHPRAETAGRRVIQMLEYMLPRYRLFGKYLFRKKANP